MAKKQEESAASPIAVEAKAPPFAIAAAVLGVLAAWFAAGAAGFLASPLENLLSCVALLLAVVVAWPMGGDARRKRSIISAALVLALLLFSMGGRVPAVCAAGIVLAALAAVHEGVAAKVITLAATAVGVLAVFRLACAAIPLVWFIADTFGRLLGNGIAAIVGQPLWIGATFGGVDLLVVMAVLYAGWLAGTTPPRMRRGLWALAAIVAAQGFYLITLAYAASLADALPPSAPPAYTDISNVGTWQLVDALRAALPWNLPLLAVGLLSAVAAGMLWCGRWRVPSIALAPARRTDGKLGRLAAAVAIAALLPLVVVYSGGRSELKDKTVVAFEYGYMNWHRPEMGRADKPARCYGMLPVLIESLGGKFFRSLSLSEADLAKADVLVLIHPDQPWPDEMKTRIFDYVRRGGSLLLAAEPFIRDQQSQSSFGELLDGLSIRVRYDTCMAAADRWEGCYDELDHPAAIGIDGNRNRYGMLLASSLAVRWPACPVTTARFGHCEPGSDANASNVGRYAAGKKLGDLVLAAEQPYGKGRIFVLGDAGVLSNDILPTSYEYVGRVLSELAHPSSLRPQGWWRELLGFVLAALLVGLLVGQPDPLRLALALGSLAVAFLLASHAAREAGAVMPDGRSRTPNDVAYIDASHLGAYSQHAWSKKGLGNFCRVLGRAGYLPLMLDTMTAEKLDRAGVLISIAPQRPFTAEETRTVESFVEGGGILVACCGAEEAAGSRSLLAALKMGIAPSPVRPGDPTYEPAALGWFRQSFGRGEAERPCVQFYAAWPITYASESSALVQWSDGPSMATVVARGTRGKGEAVLIADSFFPTQDNLTSDGVKPSGNELFWRWLLGEGLDRALPQRAMPRSDVVPEPDTLLDPDAPEGGR